MADDDRHPSANRSTRLSQLQALAADGNGATPEERENARRRLAEYEARLASEPDGVPCGASQPDRSRDLARSILADLEGVHEAEVHAGKIGTLVVWRSSEAAADRLARWRMARVRIPDEGMMFARKSSGLVHDTEADRWGVLYRAKDLRRQ